MKRSFINQTIREAKQAFANIHFALPKWAYWTPEDWKKAGPEASEIKECMLGWDLTDFGEGRFGEKGLTLFCIRNGNFNNPDNQKPYAEKIMLVKNGQVTPMHFHWSKMEDIINRGGGNLVIKLYNSDENEQLDDQSDVHVSIDGIRKTVKAGDCVTLEPGESICLTQGLYHSFWAEGGDTVVGEVSMVNDDNNDNRFHEKLGRFPEIEEDEVPIHLLCNEYPELG